MIGKIQPTRLPFWVRMDTCTFIITMGRTKPRIIRTGGMSNVKTWNKLRADWDLDVEPEGMVVLDPKKQVEEHEEEDDELSEAF